MTKSTTWNAALYDQKHAFVFKYGEDLLQLLKPQPGERILDVGCGTGALSKQISDAGAIVKGIDSAASMIAKATEAYPELDFSVADITKFQSEKSFDALFSNAVLHWVLDKEAAANNMFSLLKNGGRLVLEMGGKDNVKGIADALSFVLEKHGYTEQAKKQIWYFPSLGEYTTLLEQAGFRVVYAVHYDRETLLKDNDAGIADWIKMFRQDILADIEEKEANQICLEAQELLRPTHYREGNWYADYKRLRIVANKEKG